MRILAAFLLAAAAAGGAQASSIVVLEPMQGSIGPSMIVVGAPEGVTVEEPGGPSITTVAAEGSQNSPSVTFLSGSSSGPSIIVLRDPAATLDEEVAAIPESTDAKASMGPMPMVIRGGIAEEAFVRQAPAGASQAAAPAQASTGASQADAPTQPPALDPNDKGTPAKRKALKRQAERLAQEAASAPADVPEAAAPPGE